MTSASPRLFPGLGDGAAEPERILLLPHDPAWARRYARERDRIVCLLGAHARRIEHIGSTAVAGIAAQPIVDVMLTVRDLEDRRTWLPALEMAGYVVAAREPARVTLRSRDRAVHLHVLAAGRDEERRNLLFRECLRRSPRLRGMYEALKRDLAARTSPRSDHYALAKGLFIDRALARAPSSVGCEVQLP